jgi:hypothetical protein
MKFPSIIFCRISLMRGVYRKPLALISLIYNNIPVYFRPQRCSFCPSKMTEDEIKLLKATF